MFITRIIDATVLTIGNLNIRFNNGLLEIVDRDIYPNPIYTVPEMRVEHIGVESILNQRYFVVKTTLPIPGNIQAFPCTEEVNIDYTQLRNIFKVLPIGFDKEIEKKCIVIGEKTSLRVRGFDIYGKYYPYDEVIDFIRMDKVIEIKFYDKSSIDINFDHYTDVRLFEILFDRLLRNKICIDEDYFKYQNSMGFIKTSTYDIVYCGGLVSVYDNTLDKPYFQHRPINGIEVVKGEEGSCSCKLRLWWMNGECKEMQLTLNPDVSGLTPHKAKMARISAEEKLYRELHGLDWLIHNNG